jgi:hypothetical protein
MQLPAVVEIRTPGNIHGATEKKSCIMRHKNLFSNLLVAKMTFALNEVEKSHHHNF